MRAVLPLMCLLLLMTSACSERQDPPEEPALPEIPFRKDGTLSFERDGGTIVGIDIEVAADDSSRNRGLMQRSSLPERTGMLFLFDQMQPQSFWMAQTRISLDLYFVDSDSVIVHIARYARPMSPDPVVSANPAQYVIETVGGFADNWGIIEGDRVSWAID